MKTPSVDTKLNTHRVKTHWSVYAYWASICFSVIFFILTIMGILEYLPAYTGLWPIIMLIFSLHIMKLTQPVTIPFTGDPIAEREFLDTELATKKGEVKATAVYFLLLTTSLLAWAYL